jgi:hypothetical protein
MKGLDERGAAVHSVDQVTLLPPADELDSAAATTPVLPIVETVPDDDSEHDDDDACATSVDTASLTTHRPVVWDINVVNSDVPDALEDPDFDKYSGSSGFSRVQHLEEVNTGIPDTDDMFFDRIDGIDPRVMSMFDLNIPDSAPAHYDDLGALDHQVKAISTASRAPHRFADILRRSGDSAAKYYSTMRTKDPDVFDRVKRAHFDDGSQAVTTDVFDRVKRAHFDDGSQAVTTDDAELLWAYRLVRTKHYLKDAGGHKHSPIAFGYLRVPASTSMGFIMVGCWHTPSLPATIVSPSRICRDHNFRGFASVGLLDSNEAWVTLFHEKRTNADVTIGSHLRGGLLYSDPLIRPTAAQHANPLPKQVLCVHRVTASDPD